MKRLDMLKILTNLKNNFFCGERDVRYRDRILSSTNKSYQFS